MRPGDRTLLEILMDEKRWYASKTIWVNVVALVASLLMVFGIELTADQQASLVTSILAIVNIGLRLVTTEAIK
jgi:uncharacterized membrane protein